MTMTRTKREILSEFEVLAHEHFDGNVPDSVNRLLARLVAVGLSDLEVEPVGALDKGIVYLVGDITDELVAGEDGGVIDDLLEAHYNLPIEQPIQLIISSCGGSVPAALAVISTINQLRREGRKVNVHVAGWAMSAAFDIVQHCDYRTAEPTSFLMVHEDQYGVEGSTSKHKAEAAFSESQEKSVFEVISARTGKPVKYYQDKTKNSDWYVPPPVGIIEGLLDEIVAVPPFPPITLPEVPAKPKRTRRTKPTPTEETNATN